MLPKLASILIGFPAGSIYMYHKSKLDTIYDPLSKHISELIAAVFKFPPFDNLHVVSFPVHNIN